MNLNLRLAIRSDSLSIRDLFMDVYHWRHWMMPVFRHGLLSMFFTPIIISSLLLICITWLVSPHLALFFASFIVLACAAIFLMNLYCFLEYFKKLPEFGIGYLTEKYSKDGCAFFVMEFEEKIIGCVGVKRMDEQVPLRVLTFLLSFVFRACDMADFCMLYDRLQKYAEWLLDLNFTD